MKKIFNLILISLLLISSSYATVWETTKITQYDILKAQIFYINWEWYIKENWKLKKVEWVKFYSIAWQQYAKINWKLIKMNNNAIKKINWISYIVHNWKLMTLEKYLASNNTNISNNSKQIEDNKKTKKDNEENIDNEIWNIFKDLFQETEEKKSEKHTPVKNNETILDNTFQELNIENNNNVQEANQDNQSTTNLNNNTGSINNSSTENLNNTNNDDDFTEDLLNIFKDL